MFLVRQGKTYTEEVKAGIVWSPKTKKDGSPAVGYDNMALIKEGDYIVHVSKGKVYAVSRAVSDCLSHAQPMSLKRAAEDAWNDDGWQVNCDYHLLENEYPLKDMYGWGTQHFPKAAPKGFAFGMAGDGSCTYVQHYMSVLTEAFAKYILKQVLNKQSDSAIRAFIQEAIDSFDDDSNDKEIDRYVKMMGSSTKKAYTGHPEQQLVTEVNGKTKPQRDPKRAAQALINADFKCECDGLHKTFIKKSTGKPYTESHHLVPISKYKDFNGTSLDPVENIVSLCSTCHRLLHHGRMVDKEAYLTKLYNERKKMLEACGISLTLKKLLEYYK